MASQCIEELRRDIAPSCRHVACFVSWPLVVLLLWIFYSFLKVLFQLYLILGPASLLRSKINAVLWSVSINNTRKDEKTKSLPLGLSCCPVDFLVLQALMF